MEHPKRWVSKARAAYTHLFWRPGSRDNLMAVLERRAARTPNRPFLCFEGRWWTWSEVNAAVNTHVAAYRRLELEGPLSPGDVVALRMDNRPAYLLHVYALMKMGVVAALINPHLAEQALAHAVSASGARLLVVGAAVIEGVEVIPREGILPHAQILVDVEGGDPALPEGVGRWAVTDDAPSRSDPSTTGQWCLDDLAAYIYTSGTTGLPKAALVKHHRFLRAGRVLGGALGLTADDTIYCCLPLYHASGLLIGAASSVAQGARLVLARRFSASRFWEECEATGATACVYIGELCRYLMNSPPHPLERRHRVRRAIGNGLRPDVWEAFQRRFGVEHILEFYGATEGNAETANVLNTPGCCGMLIPGKMALARCDPDTGELAREADGFSRRVGAQETGLLLGAINPRNEYAGYRSASATAAKVLSDVFRPGDRWFNTGDLLKRDRLRRLYFVDRVGDTYRWKGENVSTSEVELALNGSELVEEVTVYGVTVPGSEGRAGMAAVVLPGPMDGAGLYAYVAEALPTYAQPRFVRVVDTLETTGTFKHRKVELRKEGWRGDGVDPVWVRDPEAAAYRPLNAAAAEAIQGGRWSL